MSRSQRLKNILDQAEEKEKKYDWVKAADLYGQALRTVGKRDFLRKGEIQKRIGYCFYRAAFQAETNKGFKSHMQLAVEAYEKGGELFEKVEEMETQAKISHCEAMAAYVNSWLATDLPAKKERLDECWRFEKEALKVYEEAADHMNVGKTCNSLTMVLIDLLDIEWNAESRERMIEGALEYGEKAIKIFSKAQDRSQLAQAYTLTASFYRNAAFVRGFKAERREECRKKALSYPEKAIEISEEIEDAYLMGLSNLRLVGAHMDILGSSGLQERQHYDKALQCAILTRDNLLVADALFGLEYAARFSAVVQEDPDKAREEYGKLDKYCEDAIRHYSLVAHDSGIAMAYSFMLYAIEERSGMETNIGNKRLLIEKSVELGYRGSDHASLSGSMGITFHMMLTLGRALVCLARVETDTGRKRALLEESAKYIEESISILKQASTCALVEPREWNLSNCMWFLALNQAELANMEETIDEKIKMLKNVITNMRGAREYWLKWIKSPWAHVETPHRFLEGTMEMKNGKMLNQLYALTGDSAFLGDGVEAFERSADAYDKANLPSRVAEAYWQIAETYNQLAEHNESAKNFESASKNYILAAEKIAQLKSFYMDYATYMQAWNAIEKARHHHARQEYGKAKEHYEKAANLHKSTERWNHLSHNYLAWARLEEAEDLSRREQTEEARDLFKQSAELFAESKRTFQAKLEKIEVRDEKEMTAELVKASDIRREYCLGRIALEKAKILDRHGDHTTSSEKYGSAAEMFQKIAKAEPERSRKELQPIIYLCQAWQKMMMAEAKASSTMYGEAAELFKQAKEHTLDQPTSLLALANSSFCKALESGTRFEAARDMVMYSKAKRYMGAAANYYLKAGFKNGADYAKATQRLFDAYIYMDKAETETEPRKKTQYYQMAERLLQASAGLYLKAKHPEKSEEARRLLESVKEERKLAMSLTEVLHAPTIASTTTSFSTPTPTHEKAVGLERFEHAAIEANIVLSSKEAKAGENFNLEMQIVNVGKEAVLLAKVEQLLPEGFELVAKPSDCHVEDAYLNMKGKRLDPVKTEKIRLVLRSFDKGTFEIKPRIFYVDENGRQLLYEPKPVTIQVSEVALQDRITTGYRDLDNLLLGGIPKDYAVILTSPSCDERNLLIKRFLETGVKEGIFTFYVTADAKGVRTLGEEFQSNLYLFICNPRVDEIIKSLPNVFKLKGVENLTDINIALTSALRRPRASLPGPKRACIEIVSDVLLQHHTVQTRRWLNALIPELKSKGFTTLAVIDPQIHSPQEFHAIVNLFEGEINIYEKENKKGLQKFLRIKKMYNQRYLESELPLRKERIEKSS